MLATTEKTLKQLAIESPAATRVFEKLGLDYCCGGNELLDTACVNANLSINQVLAEIADAERSESARRDEHDWRERPLNSLIDHICSTHHQYVRGEITRLEPLFDKVCAVHGKRHPELLEVRSLFEELADELSLHLMKEESILFPYVRRLEEAAIQHEPVLPAPFGSVKNPVAMMEHEHESAGEALRSMRAATNGYTAPPEACTSYHALYQALADFEADLHQHIHLENNLLFPRAVEMERR
jgi:regulator of cell morphogenesis and NO signaling